MAERLRVVGMPQQPSNTRANPTSKRNPGTAGRTPLLLSGYRNGLLQLSTVAAKLDIHEFRLYSDGSHQMGYGIVTQVHRLGASPGVASEVFDLTT
jgi:hypothetical protein